MRPLHFTHHVRRLVIKGFLLTFFASLLPMGQVASALSIIDQTKPSNVQPGGSLSEIRSVGSVETRYGLVAILVEDSLWGSSTSGSGFFSFLGNDGLKEKIQTYAQDVQSTLPWTKTIIIEVADDDTPVEIQRMLERFYFEGNPEDSDPTKLSGIVVVGDVPLPVVNKMGNRFISMLPYTDFEEPAYLLDSETQDFLPNGLAQNLQTEIWHGVIVPPVKGQEGIDLLASYFEKNHAFHTGDSEATTFNKKVFIGDFVTEESALNPTAFASYERFTGLWEEIAYYRYTNDLVERLFTEMQTSVEAGDFLDNDGDGAYDEEASNGIDDDSDGLIDEDLGDGFFGIDNDGDCYALAESAQDSNGDGKPCFGGEYDEDGEEILPPDNLVDEDSFADNNNDEGWIYQGYSEGSADVLFSDRMMDEDPPGDTTGGEDADGDGYPDGDGCPGLCGVDDNGDGQDADNDGFPTGLEVLYHWDWADERRPWDNVAAWTNNNFGTSFEREQTEEAGAYLSDLFVDQFYGDEYKSPTCYFDGVYHPEYDDDEDGFCDEDGKEEMQIWASYDGTRASGLCAYNDEDCDGQIDEDPLGLQADGLFDDLPDIQAREVVKTLTSRYASMFDEPQGVWNRVVAQTGRYKTRESDGETVSNDYDTAISLIAKKDELVLQYLQSLNADMEAKIDTMVEDDLSQEIPLIAGLQITGELTTEDEEGNETGTEDICDPDGDVDLDEDKCLQFVNQSGFDPFLFIVDREGEFLDIYKTGAENFYIAGEHLWNIESPAQCTTFAGTDEEEGQLAQFNTMYSREFSVSQSKMNVSEVQEYRNCVPEYASYLKDIPQVCNVATTTKPVRTLDGAKAPEEDTDTSKWEVGAEACFEFRELETFNDYSQSEAEFNNWLSSKIRNFRNDTDADSGTSYDDFLAKVEEKRDSYNPKPGEATLRKQFSELDLLRADEGRSYTMIDLMEELGYTDVSDDDVDTFIAMLDDESDFLTINVDVDSVRDLVDDLDEIIKLKDNDTLTIQNPKQGSGMGDVQTLEVNFNRLYLFKEIIDGVPTPILSDSRLLMETITSVYKHVEPTAETLNAQISNAASPNLPIDATRRVSFIDNGDDARELVYVNVFEAETVEDVKDQIEVLAEDVGKVEGGSSFVNDVEDFWDGSDGINEYQLADALAWRFMTIDEKHRYVLSHYVGEEEAIQSKARDGYEIVSIIADGTPTELFYSFNGSKPLTEEDLEFMYRSDEAIAAALAAAQEPPNEFEPIGEVSNTTPVLLGEWIQAMEDWMADVEDSLSTFGTWGEAMCSEEYVYPSNNNDDTDDSGIPDGADATTALLLSSDDTNVLLANGEGEDSYVVSVGAKQADNTINVADNYTQVTIEVMTGTSTVEIQGSSTLTLTGGVATFALKGAEPGSFSIRAVAENRDDVSNSNGLSGKVESKYVNVTTLIKEITGGTAAEEIPGAKIEVMDEEGETRAILDPETGAIELRGAEAELREAEADTPTSIAILSSEGTLYGSFFIIPEEKIVAIGDGAAGVFVQEVGANANAASAEDGVALEENDVQMGLVTALGQIALADGYALDFDNPGEINLYDPIHVLDGNGETLFTVNIKHSFTEGSIEEPVEETDAAEAAEETSFFKSLFPFFGVADAASLISDTDGDLLDDLEEWVIGTAQNDNDTDSDTYLDGLELYSGYDPTAANKKLFTDIGIENVAYPDLAKLYVRGVIKGYSDGSFKPNSPITREEFVKINLGAICKDCDSYDSTYEAGLLATYEADPFPDSNINGELLACVAEAKTSGIISGYASGSDAGYFVPKQYISRAEATKVLVETAGYEVDPVTDGAWYSEYVVTAEAHDLFPDGVTPTTAWLEANITRAEFVMMAVNLVEEQDCRSVDTDGDGLSDTEEQVIYGTDPALADTDGGGVNDLDEVLRDSDPLDASDDFPVELPTDTEELGEEVADETTVTEDFSTLSAYDHEPGVYAASKTAAYESISVSSGDEESVNVFTNDIPADGVSEIYVRAEIRDQEETLYSNDNTSVIEFVLSTTEHGKIDSQRVQVRAGVAEAKFVTSEVAGDVSVEGRISDGSIPSLSADIHVYPGEPVSLVLQGESSVLPAGAEAATEMTVYLYDEFGNLASNGFYPVTFSSEGGVTLLDLNDEDSTLDGLQVTTSDGFINFRVLASAEVETGTVQVTIPEIPDGGDSFDIQHKESLSLKIGTTKPYLLAGSSSGQTLTVSVVDQLGIPVSGFNGDVLMSLSDPGYGSFESETLTLVNGTASTTLLPGTLAGTGSIIAESAGIQGGSASVVLKPSDIYELRIRKEDGSTVMKAGDEEKFYIEGFDVYGNLASTDSSTTGALRLTEATAEYGTLSSETFTLNQGVATVRVNTGEVSGKISIVASSTGLLAGTWGGDVNYSLSGEEFADMDLQMLYASVLGAPFGDVTQENYVAGWMMFNGKTQAITTLMSEPVPKKKVATVDANGMVTLPEDGMVSEVVNGAGSELPTRIQWREFPDDTLIGELFYVPSDDIVTSAVLLTSKEAFTLEESADGTWVLKEDAAAVVKVRSDGQVVLVDPSYVLVVNGAASGLSFGVLKNTEEVMRIDFTGDWGSDVTAVEADFNLEDWATLDSGIYIKPTGASVNRLVNIPTGNSSHNAMGLAIIDPNEDLAKEMQASLGYQSLESAEDNGNIGWEDENKHLLLFAGGNTVGESNLYYPSEVGVVLGDPTIKLQTLGDLGQLGYTTDVGKLVSTSSEAVLTLMDIDYNGDNLPDVLTAYEDGRIEVLQNAKSATRLENRGELLYIENGISSIDKGDFNNDGLEDLIIVTKEACYEGETCLYEYENIGGGFAAKNLSLTGISGTPTQVEVGDLNGDDYDELVIVDENMVLYTVWNSEGVLDTVDEVKNFGLNTNSTENLFGDVAVRTDGLAKGSVTLSLLTDDFSGAEGADAFLEALGVDADYTASSTEGLERKENLAFEYADASTMSKLVEVTKTVSDPSGGSVEVGDVLTYTLTIKNISGGAFTDLYVSDSVGNSFQFLEESLVCSDCIQDGDSNRPFIYGPLSLSNAESLSFTYDVSVESLPRLSVMLGNDFQADYKDDNYMDIAISPEGNTSGELLVFYSDGYATEVRDEGFLGLGGSSFRRISYQEKSYSPADDEEAYDTTVPNPFGDEDEDGVPDFLANMDADKGIPVAKNGDFDPIAEVMGGVDADNDGYYSTDEMFDNTDDADGDGINDIVDNWVSGSDLLLDPSLDLETPDDDDVELSEEIELELDAEIALLDEEVAGVTDKIEEIVSMFTCNGGCIAFPGSVAFLAPGMYHMPLTGATIGFDPGTPVFGILPYLPVVCTGQMCYASNVFRIYLAPTTTLGLGLGICLGPYGGAGLNNCFAFNVPLLQLLSLCDVINGYIADGMSKASAFVTGDEDTVYNVMENLSNESGATGLESSVFSGYNPPISTNLNIQVPGFPSIFTEWWKAQKEEFFKVLDLPDITFIYPDPKSLTTEFTGISAKIDKSRAENVVDLDQKNKLEQLTSGFLGLEKWLNTANALPLIDIKPEKVVIRYPALTKEEREIFKRDMQDWVTDAKLEIEDFKKQIDIRDDLTAIQTEAAEALISTVEEAIVAVETNMATLDSYAEIPKQILILRDMEAYYAKTIICYVDAILSNTAGYLTENVQRIDAWGQWVFDLKKIIDGWQILIDLSADLMDSCDKCTNQRYSGMQLIFSLFIFIPDFPVVELPKLPDIVIDVSNIQAGIDIVWPDIDFVPERINIPELPRLIIPDVNIKLDANFDLDLEIPLLPTFDVNIELPAPPPLSLPNLPSLPPPPAIPELDPNLKAALNISSNILKIVCIIRQGFIPINEMNLKSKIEEITERPGGIVLPFDLALTVEWPEFNYDYWKEIQVNTYLNLKLDVTALYDVIAGIGEESNELVTDGVDKLINENLKKIQEEIQAIFDFVGSQELNIEAEIEAEASADFTGEDAGFEGDVDAEGDAEAEINTEIDSELYDQSYKEAMDTAIAYKDNPLVMQNLIALRQVMNDLQTELTAWDAEMPDQITLTGESEILALDDPRLHRYDEIIADPSFDKEFLASIEDTPLASLVTLRDSMIAYTQDLDQGTLALRGMDDESFQRYLASENISSQFMLASEEGGFLDAAAGWNPEKLVTEADDTAEIELASESTDGLNLGTQAKTYDEGLYLYNSELGINERLSVYTQEAKEASSILMIDLDSDGDEDVVYSMGGDIYLKENHTEEPSLSYTNSDPSESTVADMDPTHGSVQNLKRGNNDYEEASFSFSAAEAIGYEMLLYDSLDAQQAEPDENIKRLLLLADSENESTPFTNEDGDSAGELLSSRLWVNSLDGKVKLKNGYKRTLISSNGEITVDDFVTFQTIEDSSIEFTVDDISNSIEVPAHTLITFGQNKEQTIRVENGSVYWVEKGETVEEQDVSVDMEIFADELVVLDSLGAELSLVSTEGTTINMDKQESFLMSKLTSLTNPTVSVDMENGAYYSVSRTVQSDGSFGTLSDVILLNPQVCADDSEPYTLIDDGGADTDGDGAIEVALFSTKELSAEASFDSDSEIVDAYWDLDSGIDSDGDGVTNNDEQVIGLTAEVGPYEDLNDRLVTLYVTDAAGNVADTEIAVEIYVPDITLSDATTTVIAGSTNPTSELFPYHLVRDRSGAVNEIGTGYSTDENGDISEEMIPSDLLSVYDGEGATIAQFNPKTKQVMVYDDAYDATILPSDADWPSRLAVYEKTLGAVMGSFLFVTDSARAIQEMSVSLDSIDLSLYNGVTVYPVTDAEGYEFTDTSLVARDDLGSLDFIVSQTGNITIFDDRYSLVKRAASSLEDYLIIEVYDNGVLELQIWPGTPDATFLTTTDELGLPASSLVGQGESLSADYRLYFEDIEDDDELYQDIAELVEREVLEGYTVEGEQYFKPNQSITRAEFTKIILGILCITPSEEAELLPSVFSDILDTGAWYFAYTKESYLRDLITGYLGEVNSSGVAPFKPNTTITRAEATKIVLEALNQEGIIELPADLTGEPWYEPYMEVAQDLTPYLTGEATAGESNYIVTVEEAADPMHAMTRYEFVEMSVRVLKAYNCFDLDSDGDGLINYDEENKYGTDPYNPDTDAGGVDDGSEVGRSSDPLEKSDDFGDGSLEGIEPGIYAVREACMACPCNSTIDYDADLRPGDTVFAIIRNDAGEIFGVSNTLTVEE